VANSSTIGTFLQEGVQVPQVISVSGSSKLSISEPEVPQTIN